MSNKFSTTCSFLLPNLSFMQRKRRMVVQKKKLSTTEITELHRKE